jgi:hypothetical protein
MRNGIIIVVQTDEGEMLVRVEGVVKEKCFKVTDSSGAQWVIGERDYTQASLEQVAEYYAARLSAWAVQRHTLNMLIAAVTVWSV